MDMKVKLEFLETLRKEFPVKKDDTFAEHPRCTVGDIVRRLGISHEEVWKYVGELSKDGLIDNNGGKLRFNNSVKEDFAEIYLLQSFARAESFFGDMPVGFIYKVIHGMYRGDNFCAGKLAAMRYEMSNGKDYMETLTEITNAMK